MAVTAPTPPHSTESDRQLPSASPVTVFIAEPDAPLCSALRRQIRKVDNFRVVGQASRPADAIDRALALKPQILLIDCDLDGMHEPESYQALRESLPDSQIVILLDNADPERVLHCVATGMDACCLRETSLENLPTALPIIASGGFWLDPAVRVALWAAVLAQQSRRNPEPAEPALITVPESTSNPPRHARLRLSRLPRDFWVRLIVAGVVGLMIEFVILDWAVHYEPVPADEVPLSTIPGPTATIPGIAYTIAELRCRAWTRYRGSSALAESPGR